jgi:hypothetical protein
MRASAAGNDAHGLCPEYDRMLWTARRGRRSARLPVDAIFYGVLRSAAIVASVHRDWSKLF